MGGASYDFTGSTALVTGAAGDIGRAVAVRLAVCGANVVLTDLTEASEQLERTQELCSAAGASALASVPADVTDPISVEECFAAATAQFGPPSLVFNNAGYQACLSPQG